METTRQDAGLTPALVRRALQVRHDDLPDAVRRTARDCLVDWLGCAYAGLDEPVSGIVGAAVREEGAAPQASLIGSATRVSAAQAALVNGTASHALDYDDVNLTLPGHVSVAVLPAVLALAQHRRASLTDAIAAYVAGYETACRIGALVEPAHYANGFHATGTIGSLGAAIACAHLLRLSEEQACHAVGAAATQAAGLKAMFGTMAKPLHAGMAAQTGVRSAMWAARGFISRPDALECAQGFALAHGTDLRVEDCLAEPAAGFHLLDNIFKFHAACFSTHSTIEAVRQIAQQQRLQPSQVTRIDVVAGKSCAICNIQAPATALEAKFSLRATAAFALLDIDTSRLDTWAQVSSDEVRKILERVQVRLVPGMNLSSSIVTVHAADGRVHELASEVGIPMADKAEQTRRVDMKFLAIAGPVVGESRARRVLDRMDSPDATLDDLLTLPQRIDQGDRSQ